LIQRSQLELVTTENLSLTDGVCALSDDVRSHERAVMQLADATNRRLEQASQLGRLQQMATGVSVDGNYSCRSYCAQVISWIGHQETVLNATLAIPTTLGHAEELQNDYREFQLTMDVSSSIYQFLQIC
jgi:hypothetical protein